MRPLASGINYFAITQTQAHSYVEFFAYTFVVLFKVPFGMYRLFCSKAHCCLAPAATPLSVSLAATLGMCVCYISCVTALLCV